VSAVSAGGAGLTLLHRRLAVGMALCGLVAFGAGVGPTEPSPWVAGAALALALFWRPSPALSARLEHVWLPLAFVLVVRALYHVLAIRGDVVIPVVDLLLLLLCAEALRSLDTPNDVRIYALSFALLLAASAYRPGVLFALAFVAYVVISTLALMAGHMRRKLAAHGMDDVPLGRSVMLTTAALSAVTLGVSALVFLTFPRVSQGWAGRGETLATSVAGFSDEISLAEFGATIHANPEIVLRVEFPDGRPPDFGSLHWRGRSYDRFDGVRWSRSGRILPSSGSRDWYRERWPAPRLHQRIYGAPLDRRVLFGVHPLVRVEPESAIHPLIDNVGDGYYWGSAAPIYSAWSPPSAPPADELRRARGQFMPDESHYLQLPRLPRRVHALADSLTAGLETRFDKAARVESWLRSEFDYTLDLPRTAGEATLDHFLFERRAGHCEYFSTAMTILLRAAGIHARNVNGFLGGRWSEFGQYLVVTQNEAHSWVEVWFPGYGWVTFDPTPPGSAGAGAAGDGFWPGRFLLDALQHRWGKWVLDYSLQNQSDVLGGLLSFLRPGDGEADTGEGGRDVRSWFLWTLAGVMGTSVLVAVVLARGPARTPETRLYLRLVELGRGAGVVKGRVAPLELVDRIRERAGPAAPAAARLVDLYLRARFAGETLDDAQRTAMHDALGDARRALRTTGRGT